MATADFRETLTPLGRSIVAVQLSASVQPQALEFSVCHFESKGSPGSEVGFCISSCVRRIMRVHSISFAKVR